MTKRVTAFICIMPVFAAVGCQQPLTLPAIVRPAFLFGSTADPKLAADLRQLDYPKDAPLGDDLDIIVVKDGGHISVINRTSHAYHDVQLWLNQQYVARIDTVEVGTGNVVPLNKCINHFGEPFPVGGLLNPDINYPVVLAELYEPPGAVTPPEGKGDGNAKGDDNGTADHDGKADGDGKGNGDGQADANANPATGRRHRLVVRSDVQ